MGNRRRFGAVVVLAAFVALTAGEVRAQKGKKKDGPLPSAKADSSKLPAGKYAGVLKSTPNADGLFDLEFAVPGGKKMLVEFQLAEKAKVRTLLLPEAFDDKGNPKNYTRKELADLKGADRSLPGYESAVEQLGAGQTVQLTLVAVPRTPAGKKKGEDALEGTVEKSKKVRLVVIVRSPEGGEGGKPAVKKK